MAVIAHVSLADVSRNEVVQARRVMAGLNVVLDDIRPFHRLFQGCKTVCEVEQVFCKYMYMYITCDYARWDSSIYQRYCQNACIVYLPSKILIFLYHFIAKLTRR